MPSPMEQLQQMVDESRNIVFFGGAGVSTESGVPDFRSVDGLYNQQYRYPPEQMLSHSFFVSHKNEFFDFYKNKILYLDVKPNPAHQKLAELEKAKRLSAVITQNIDGLHQAAGSQNVIELHGSVHRNSCQSCGQSYTARQIKESDGVPRCQCGGEIKPDVVLYEEPLDQNAITAAVRAISDADMLIVGGTSLVVYPAAGLLDYFSGRHLVVINKSPTGRDLDASLVISEAIGSVFSQLRVPG